MYTTVKLALKMTMEYVVIYVRTDARHMTPWSQRLETMLSGNLKRNIVTAKVARMNTTLARLRFPRRSSMARMVRGNDPDVTRNVASMQQVTLVSWANALRPTTDLFSFDSISGCRNMPLRRALPDGTSRRWRA